ncbi:MULTISPECIES: hypothetical protein [unclassified Streptomyces]|uniref:hypothetical protein n=1 Tax=unclassified Streptomyces TaxID=2593676 RepID=UPI0022571129|nr:MULTISPECIES: hypothetical protein [unclassified Streptomyces]MCX4524666.1 hypothetical protein [Streptomyces sp. NBC_01551]MCX4544826.1 hypothetical protein [Streptomyces sp. NBC_01565]
MNGNPQIHATLLAVSTLLLLPLPLLVLAGRTPAWLRARVAAPRPMALALISFWLPAPFGAVPRILDAGFGVVMACTLVSLLFGCAGVAFFLRSARAERRTRRGHAQPPAA